MHLAAVAFHDIRSDDFIRCPVAALHQMIRPHALDQRQRRVVVEGRDQRNAAERGGVLGGGDMSGRQDVEAAVGEDNGTGELRQPRLELRGVADDFTFAAGQSRYSNSLTTRVIPPTVRVASAASSPSFCVTSPMR